MVNRGENIKDFLREILSWHGEEWKLQGWSSEVVANGRW